MKWKWRVLRALNQKLIYMANKVRDRQQRLLQDIESEISSVDNLVDVQNFAIRGLSVSYIEPKWDV